MPRRRRRRLSAAPTALGLAVLVAGVLGAGALGGCQGDVQSDASCAITQQAVLAGTPLTLARDARLERAGGGYALIGADGDSVRWAALDPATGTLGPEQSVTVPQHRPGLWYALAGAQAPGDTVLVAFAETSASGADIEVQVMAVPVCWELMKAKRAKKSPAKCGARFERRRGLD